MFSCIAAEAIASSKCPCRMSLMEHECWSKDPDSAAGYVLAVSFEVVGREMEIYDDLRIAVEELQSELKTEIELEIGVD